MYDKDIFQKSFIFSWNVEIKKKEKKNIVL